MPPTAPPPRPSTTPRPANAPPPAQQMKLDLTPRKAKPPCPRIVLTAVEGFGKTSLLAHAPSPYIMMARGETGYDTLLSANLVPAVPAAVVEEWPQGLATLDALIENPQGIKTLGIDAMGGMERLCHEFTCRTMFNNDWGDSGFTSFNKGYEASVTEWLKLLQRLETLQTRHGIVVVMLGHSKIKTFKNPLGADFDRYVCDVHDKTWAATARWADVVMFGNFLTIIDKEKKGKGKGIGGTDRVLYTERRDAWDAKNRFGMAPEIWLEGGPSNAWSQVWSEIVRDKSVQG
jgi:hypothetical protein